MFRLTALVLVLTALAALVGAADRDFSMDVEPLYLGTSQPMRIQPFAITVENRGRDTSGVVTVTVDDASTRYPIELPQGSRKRLTAYLTASYTLRGTATLSTPEGGTQFRFESNASPSSRCIVAVTDAPGVLGFLRNSGRDQYAVTDLYLKPDMMPDRAAGYVGVGAVYLGEGAERMSNEAFLALKRYIISGGVVIVTGGASMPLQGDPRWRPLLPVVNARPKTIQLNASLYGLQAKGDFTLGVGQLARGATSVVPVQGMPLIAKKPFGFGRVVYIALNLTEGPAKDWEGREKIFETAGLTQESGRLAQFLNSASPDEYAGSYSYPGGAYSSAYRSGGPYPGGPGMPGYGMTEPGTDPFSAKVPDTTTVIFILVVYFILVVPVNLLVLRKMGKGEWAWISAPILSLGFAFVFFRFSAGLYSADLSAASSGVILATDGEPEAYYMGKTQMFFPRGGRYDLQFKGVEAILGESDQQTSIGRESTLASLDPVDTGELLVPGASVTNLAFREFSFLQRVNAGTWIHVEVERSEGKVAKVTVSNRSPYSIKEVGVFVKGQAFGLGDLAPAQTKAVTSPGFVAQDFMIDVASSVAQGGLQGVVTGIVDGFRPGPQIGHIVPAYNRNRLMFTFSDGAN